MKSLWWPGFLLLTLMDLAPARALDLNANDKRLHVAMSMDIAAAGVCFSRQAGLNRWQSALIGGSFALLVGWAKEYKLDAKADTEDIEANVFGVAIGVAIPFRLEF